MTRISIDGRVNQRNMHARGVSAVFSTRFVVKPEEGQQCIFYVFLSEQWGVNENLGG